MLLKKSFPSPVVPYQISSSNQNTVSVDDDLFTDEMGNRDSKTDDLDSGDDYNRPPASNGTPKSVEDPIQNNPVKRPFPPAKHLQPPEAVVVETIPNAAGRPRKKVNDDPRISLTAKIDRDLQARLKIHSYRTHLSIATLIEGWIETHCKPLD